MQSNGRCIRFAPMDLRTRGPELARWRAKYVPRQWRGNGDHVLYRRERAAELNERYGPLLDAFDAVPMP